MHNDIHKQNLSCWQWLQVHFYICHDSFSFLTSNPVKFLTVCVHIEHIDWFIFIHDLTYLYTTFILNFIFLSGGFLYIATVSILPVVLRSNGNDSVIQVLCECSAFLVGVGFMVAVALLEESEHAWKQCISCVFSVSSNDAWKPMRYSYACSLLLRATRLCIYLLLKKNLWVVLNHCISRIKMGRGRVDGMCWGGEKGICDMVLWYPNRSERVGVLIAGY